jgi:hypothetical protein
VAVWEDQSVAVAVGKHRSVQLKQIPVKRFNNSCEPVVGVAAQTACRNSAECPDVVYVLELSLGFFIHTICSVMQNGDVCNFKDCFQTKFTLENREDPILL